jgi:hypothetical protein
MKRLIPALFSALTSFALCAPTLAEPQTEVLFDRLQRGDGARVVPEKFLRSWDPITIFFDSTNGPKAGGPEDAASKFVSLIPEPAGEWRWLGPRALQFRPAEPWRPLQRVAIKSSGYETRLVTLLPTPSATNPAESGDPVSELAQISLTFPEPVDLAALGRLLSI